MRKFVWLLPTILHLSGIQRGHSQTFACDTSHGQEPDHSILFQRKVSIGSVAHKGVDAPTPVSQITAANSGSPSNTRLVTNSTLRVYLVNVLERITKHTRSTNHQVPVPVDPDMLMSLVMMLFVVVPLCCGGCYLYFVLGGFGDWSSWFTYDLHDKEHKNRGGMHEHEWMVLTEEGIRNVKFFAFRDQALANKFYNSCASFIARVMYQPLPDGTHAELRCGGTNSFARDQIRTWSLRPRTELVAGKYNVVIYKKQALFYCFGSEQAARNFMTRFEWLAAVLYDPTGTEVFTTASPMGCGVHRIRSAVAQVSSSKELRKDTSDPLVRQTRTRGLSSASMDSDVALRSGPLFDVTLPRDEQLDPPTPGCGGTMI
mmetsp:Transcript_110569/g.195837  ORF Transcript_110569/g.195837 Transcript_110569/m.195837 type:complete len:372 (+) Transcript_110569:120-1235(+)